MSGIPFQSSLARRQVARLGQAATLTTYAISGQDSYGDDSYTETTQTMTVLPSYVTNTREPFDRRGELGHYMNMHMEFFTFDDVDLTPMNNPTDKRPTLTTEGLEYEVLDAEDSQTGIVRFLCYRRRE